MDSTPGVSSIIDLNFMEEHSSFIKAIGKDILWLLNSKFLGYVLDADHLIPTFHLYNNETIKEGKSCILDPLPSSGCLFRIVLFEE